jgi:hypothetical protein
LQQPCPTLWQGSKFSTILLKIFVMSLARQLQPVSFEEYLASQRGEGQRFDFWDGTLVELKHIYHRITF